MQQEVVQRLVDRGIDFAQRLQQPFAGSWESLTPDWVRLKDRPLGLIYGGLQADKVDVLATAGVCDPVPCLPLEARAVVESEDLMFAEAPAGLDEHERVLPEDKQEYIKLVVRQLRAKLLGLAAQAKAGGPVVAVGKPGGTRQRVVWNGSRVSAAACRPPKPRRLASPTALSFLECSDSR